MHGSEATPPAISRRRRCAGHPTPAWLRQLCWPAALVLLATAGVANAETDCATLTSAVDAASALDPAQGEIEARATLAAAIRDDAGRWISGSASVRGSWLSDRYSDTVGLREYEGGINLPLRLPGERDALQTEAQAASRTVDDAEALRRLDVAARVRETLWDTLAARAQAAMADHEVEHLTELRDLVARRTARGDAAALELDLIEGELAAARAVRARADGEARAALEQWRRVTGCAEPAPDAAETPAEATATRLADGHPALELAGALRNGASARLAASRARPGQAPMVGLTLRRERGQAQAPWIDAVGVSVTMPIGGSGARVRAEAVAAQELAVADADRLRLRRALDATLRSAKVRMEASAAAHEATGERLVYAEQALARARLAWEAGEWDTVDLLRVEGMTAEARLSEELARIEVRRAIARLNQAAGVTP